MCGRKTDDAVADVMAVLKLACDCGSNPFVVSLLVGAAIEKSATDVLAANLGRLSPGQLDRLAQAIEALPAVRSAADGIRLNGQNSCDWLTRILEAEAVKDVDPKAGGRFLARMTEGVTCGDPAKDAADAARRKRLETLSWADVREPLIARVPAIKCHSARHNRPLIGAQSRPPGGAVGRKSRVVQTCWQGG